MDGEAIMQAFTTCSGPDCFKEITPTYGKRLKVYSAIKSKLEVNPTYNNCINLPGTNYLNNVCLGREQFNDPGFSTVLYIQGITSVFITLFVT